VSEKTDILLATALLAGSDGRGQENFDYLVRGSKEDYDARKALVRVLLSDRGPPPTMLRQIAALFDPDPPKHEDLSGGESGMAVWEASHRQLIFAGRSNRRKSRGARNLRIASWMHFQRRKGVSLKEVRRRASREFKLSDARLKEIWSKRKSEVGEFRAILEAAYAGRLSPEWIGILFQQVFSDDHYTPSKTMETARLVSKVTK
jgi:hypothetical protein